MPQLDPVFYIYATNNFLVNLLLLYVILSFVLLPINFRNIVITNDILERFGFNVRGVFTRLVKFNVLTYCIVLFKERGLLVLAHLDIILNKIKCFFCGCDVKCGIFSKANYHILVFGYLSM